MPSRLVRLLVVCLLAVTLPLQATASVLFVGCACQEAFARATPTHHEHASPDGADGHVDHGASASHAPSAGASHDHATTCAHCAVCCAAAPAATPLEVGLDFGTDGFETGVPSRIHAFLTPGPERPPKTARA